MSLEVGLTVRSLERPARTGEWDFMDEWYPIQVKQTAKVGRPDIDTLRVKENLRSTKVR